MRATVASPASRAPMAVLAIAIVLALIGITGVLTGAADSDTGDSHHVASRSTTTTTTLDTSDSSSVVTVTTPTTGAATTLKANTATTKPKSTTTQPSAAACATSTGSGNPGGPKAPAVGTYNYASCTSDDKVNIVVSIPQNGGSTRRDIQTQSQLGNITAHDVFGANGVVQDAATIVAFGFTLNCDWMPDITEYPANLSVGASWSADSQCSLGNGAKIHATGTRKITGVSSIVVDGTSVSGWLIDETQTLVITAPGSTPTTFTATSTDIYNASRGVMMYERAVTEASGRVSQPKTTTEIRLVSLTPKS